eukprot:14023847-Ditylum_brightwellii.AAC.1
MPHFLSAVAVTAAANNLIAALCNPALIAPFRPLLPTHLNAIKKLAKIFNKATKQMTLPPPPLLVPPSRVPHPRVAIQPSNNPTTTPTLAALAPTHTVLRVEAAPTNNPTAALPPLSPSNPITSSVTPDYFTKDPVHHHYPTWSKAPVIPPDEDNFPSTPCPQPKHYRSPHVIPPDTVNYLVRHTFAPHFCKDVLHPTTGQPMEYEQLIKDLATKDIWRQGMCHELGCLAKGFKNDTKGTNTVIFFDHKQIRSIPKDQTVTYARIVVDFCPQKQDPYH